MGGQSTPHRTEPGEERNCINHETISNGDAFTAAASYASLATASTSHFWSIVPTYETSNVCWNSKRKENKMTSNTDHARESSALSLQSIEVRDQHVD